MYNLIEYSDNYSKISGSLWKYDRDEQALTNAGTLHNFLGNSASFKFKQKITGKTDDANGRKDVEIIKPLKYSSNFWRTLEVLLIKCEINLILTWSEKCMLSNDTKATTFAITGTKLRVPVALLATKVNAKLLQQLKSGFKRTINWKKYQSKVSIQAPYLDYLIDPWSQRVNRLFVLAFENSTDKTVHTK